MISTSSFKLLNDMEKKVVSCTLRRVKVQFRAVVSPLNFPQENRLLVPLPLYVLDGGASRIRSSMITSPTAKAHKECSGRYSKIVELLSVSSAGRQLADPETNPRLGALN